MVKFLQQAAKNQPLRRANFCCRSIGTVEDGSVATSVAEVVADSQEQQQSKGNGAVSRRVAGQNVAPSNGNGASNVGRVTPRSHMEQEKRMRREIANSNERRRMQSINAGFQSLRTLLPHHEGEKLSKVGESLLLIPLGQRSRVSSFTGRRLHSNSINCARSLKHHERNPPWHEQIIPATRDVQRNRAAPLMRNVADAFSSSLLPPSLFRNAREHETRYIVSVEIDESLLKRRYCHPS